MGRQCQEQHFKQQGVGMIEVLVTLFILSIGLLGIASLQFIGTLTNAEALSRSQAVIVAQQMSERLRANAVTSNTTIGLVVDNNYFDDDLYNFENLSCATTASDFACHCLNHPVSIPNCRNSQCSQAEIAMFDAYELSCSVASSHPNTRINLTCSDNNLLDGDTCSVGSRHSVILKWPVQNWQDNERTLNPECNVGETEAFDCVVLDITL